MKKTLHLESDLSLQNTISLMAKNDEVLKCSGILKEALKYIPKHYKKLQVIRDDEQQFEKERLQMHMAELRKEFGYTKWQQKTPVPVQRLATFDKNIVLSLEFKEAVRQQELFDRSNGRRGTN